MRLHYYYIIVIVFYQTISEYTVLFFQRKHKLPR